MPDLVSIVIPNHNLGRFVGEAIDSALDQSHPDVEVIVVDDGSADDSVLRIRSLPAYRSGRFCLIEQANAGVSRARNAGAARARGSYLVFLDADDVLEPTYVARCIAALRDAPDSVAYAYTQMQHFGAESSLFESRPFDAGILLTGNFVNASALMRRRAFDEVGGWDPYFSLAYEDYELWVRMLAHGYSGIFVPEPLLRYRRHVDPSRNDLSPAQLLRLHDDVAIRHPRLYWLRLLSHPHRAITAWKRMRTGRSA